MKKHLKATQSGQLDAFVVWFELALDDDIIISNCPTDKKPKHSQITPCWNQAIYNISNEKSQVVDVNQLITVECKLRHDCILAQLPVNKSSSLAAIHQETNESNLNIWLSRFEIALLNNCSYQDFYTTWLENEIEKIERTTCPQDLRIGYLSNTFCRVLFGLLAKYESIWLRERNLTLKLELFVSSVHEDFAENLASTVRERFPNVKVNLMSELVETSAKADRSFELDYLIFEPIDVKYGVMKKNLISDLLLIKSLNSKKGGIFLIF